MTRIGIRAHSRNYLLIAHLFAKIVRMRIQFYARHSCAKVANVETDDAADMAEVKKQMLPFTYRAAGALHKRPRVSVVYANNFPARGGVKKRRSN